MVVGGLSRGAAWHRQNPERARATEHEWRRRNAVTYLPRKREWAKRYRARTKAENPERWRLIERERALRKNYGIGIAEWDALFGSQGRRCAICGGVSSGKLGRWHTDHDHATGRVRGILCARCNLLVGALEDGRVSLAQQYLARTIFP